MWAWQTENGKVWSRGNCGRLTVLCELHVQEWLCLVILLMYAATHCSHSVDPDVLESHIYSLCQSECDYLQSFVHKQVD